MKNNREFFENKAHTILLFITLIICGFAMSGLFLFSALTDPDPNIKILSFIPILMLLFCLYLCIRFYSKITNPKAYIIVDSKGIQYNGGFLDTSSDQKTFLWLNIKKLSIGLTRGRNPTLELKIVSDKGETSIPLRTMADKERKLLISRIEAYKPVQDERKLIENFSHYSKRRIIFIILGLILGILIECFLKK